MSSAIHNTKAKQHSSGLSVDRLAAQGKFGPKTGSGFYDCGNFITEEMTQERDVELIRLREFLREIGER